jgi:hypothetical protein
MNSEQIIRRVVFGMSWVLLGLAVTFVCVALLSGEPALGKYALLLAITAGLPFLAAYLIRHLRKTHRPASTSGRSVSLRRAIRLWIAGVCCALAAILAVRSGQRLVAEVAVFAAAFLVLVPLGVLAYAPIRERTDEAARRFGFGTFAEYYRARLSVGWDDWRIANELGWSVSKVRGAVRRTAAQETVSRLLHG